MRIAQWLGLILLACLPVMSAGAAEVIANKGVPVSQLSVANARAIFGMRQVKWPDGTLIRVFVLPDNHPVHGAFCKERLNLYPYQMRQSWDRLVYSGMAQAPEEVASEAEMIARVAAIPGAIGYVSRVPGNNEKIRGLHVE
jgi:ABC-type phosphate transport system substrate-binding protein